MVQVSVFRDVILGLRFSRVVYRRSSQQPYPRLSLSAHWPVYQRRRSASYCLSVCHSSRPFKIALTEDQHVFFFLCLPQFLCTESRITWSPPVPLCCLPLCCLPLESTRTLVTRAAYMHALWRMKHDFALYTLLLLTFEQDLFCTIKLHKLCILRQIFWFCGLGTFYLINIRQKMICFVKVNHFVLVPKAYQI